MSKKYVIVGASAGGISAALRLRRLDENAEITVFDKDAYVDCASAGMPYMIGGVVRTKEALHALSAEHFLHNHNIKIRLRCEVKSIDRYEKRVCYHDAQSNRNYKLKFDKLVLATGTVPIRPEIEGLYRPGVFSLKDINDMTAILAHISDKNVRRAAVIGGGAMGLQVAENLSRRGIKTCIVEQRSHALPCFDWDMSQFARMTLEDNGVALITRASVMSAETVDEGIRLTLSEKRAIIADIVVLCTGVMPEVGLAKCAGLGIGVTGGMIVDDRLQTSDKDIYAVGDAVEVETLHGGKTLISKESTARRQGRTAADNICGIGSRYKFMVDVSVLKLFDITLASAGLTERQLAHREIRYEKVYVSGLSHAPYYPGAEKIRLKLIFDKRSGTVYGAQIVGKLGVDKRIDVLATAMRAGLTADKLADLELSFTPSFSNATDVVNRAGLVARNVMHGFSDIVHWHEVKNMEDVLMLDVRTQAERDAGTIAWSVHIPLDELRARLPELPRGKEMVVFSQDGRRAYEAERILKQKGFKAKNLSGGYSLYELFERKG